MLKIFQALFVSTLLIGFLYHTSLQADDQTVRANPKDVDTVDHIIEALYASISGPKGQKRDWGRFRSLFFKDARLIPTSSEDTDGATSVSVDGYINRVGSFFIDNGFYEQETGRTTERFGNIAQLFSVYESRYNADAPKPFARGINSIQLLHHDNRWWIVTIFWQGETKETPIPEQFLSQN